MNSILIQHIFAVFCKTLFLTHWVGIVHIPIFFNNLIYNSIILGSMKKNVKKFSIHIIFHETLKNIYLIDKH